MHNLTNALLPRTPSSKDQYSHNLRPQVVFLPYFKTFTRFNKIPPYYPYLSVYRHQWSLVTLTKYIPKFLTKTYLLHTLSRICKYIPHLLPCIGEKGLSPGRCNGGLSTDLISTQWVEMRSVDRPHFDPLGGNEVC